MKNVLHLLARLVGLTGIVVALAGLVIWREASEEIGEQVAYIGAGMAAFGLLVELIAVLRLLLSRRGAMGGNVLVQIVVVAALLVGVNAFSFLHYQRFDGTRNREFTLDENLRAELSKLRGETTIVVYRRQSSINPQGKADHYAAAADRKIVEKVRDLVEQFQELGPRFRVQNLDIDEENFEDKLAALKRQSAVLGEAIDNAPENSIVFHSRLESAEGAREYVQRLSFNEIYQLDKQASQEANESRGNLVLRYQGAGPFARKVLNVEEKRPRIAVGAVYETDTLESPGQWGMNGVKKALALHGFESRDIILKRGQFVVLTYDEHKEERAQAQLEGLDAGIKRFREAVKILSAEEKDFQRPLAEINKKYGLVPAIVGGVVVPQVLERREIAELKKKLPRLQARDVNEDFRREHLEDLKDDLDELRISLSRAEERRDKLQREKSGFNPEELAEKRRITDLRAKLNRVLADCDLLVLPRLTLNNVALQENWQYSTYRLDDAQVDSLRDFLKAGKPILFLLSPPFDDKDGADDGVDRMLAELGIRLGRDTVFYDVDAEALAELRANPELRRAQGEAPAVAVDWSKGAGLLRHQTKYAQDARHALRTSLRLGTRLGKNQALELHLRHPRPVYALTYFIPPENAASLIGVAGDPLPAALLLPSRGIEKIDERALFLLSGPESWNEEQPLPQGNRIPQFERPKANDPNKGTVREKRRGPFPIAAAVETKVPASWLGDSPGAVRPTVRVAAIGHGGVFLGSNLTPAQEKLLLDTCNWLLGRDDLLARDTQPWQYPRVQLDESESALWTWGTRLGLPLIFAYFGMVMLLVRRMR